MLAFGSVFNGRAKFFSELREPQIPFVCWCFQEAFGHFEPNLNRAVRGNPQTSTTCQSKILLQSDWDLGTKLLGVVTDWGLRPKKTFYYAFPSGKYENWPSQDYFWQFWIGMAKKLMTMMLLIISIATSREVTGWERVIMGWLEGSGLRLTPIVTRGRRRPHWNMSFHPRPDSSNSPAHFSLSQKNLKKTVLRTTRKQDSEGPLCPWWSISSWYYQKKVSITFALSQLCKFFRYQICRSRFLKTSSWAG